MSSQEHKQKIWNYIKDIKVGMLTTVDGDDLRARPMHLVQDEYDGTLWFFVKASSEKTEEIEDQRNVCLSFCDHKNDVYISLSGHAQLTWNDYLIDKFWSPFVAAWFPEGKDDPNVALLEIKIYQGEHWDADNSKITQLYEIAKANITNETPDMGENKKFG